MRQRRMMVGAVAITLLLAACGGDDDASGDSTRSTAATTDAPTTAADTVPPAPDSIDTTTTARAPEAVPLDPTKILREGTTYITSDALGVPLQFTATADTRWAVDQPGSFALSRDARGSEGVLGMADVSQAHVFEDPLADWGSYGGDNSTILAATSDPPADFLAYFATLPGVTVGPVTETEFMGLPARSVTYEVGALPGGTPCNGEPTACLLVYFVPTGITSYYIEGNAGTLYLFDLAGTPVLADIFTSEADAADVVLATMRPAS